MSETLTERDLGLLETGAFGDRHNIDCRAAAEIRWRRAEAEDAIEHAMLAARYIGKLEAENAELRESLKDAI